MALIDVPLTPYGTFAHTFDHRGATAPRFTNQTLDATNDQVGVVFRAPRTGSINTITCRVQAVTTPANLQARLETVVTTTGLPSGTLATVNSSGTIAATPAAITTYATTLTASHSATEGDMLAAVVKMTGAGSLQIASGDRGPLSTQGECYSVTDNAGAGWAKASLSASIHISVGYDVGGGSVEYYEVAGMWQFDSFTALAYNNTTATREAGLRFRLPMPARLRGIELYLIGNVGDFDVLLYDDTPTQIATLSIDKDYQLGTQNGRYRFASGQTLAASTYYRLLIKPTSASNVTLYSFTCSGFQYLGLYPGSVQFHYASRNSAGTHSSDITSRIWGGVLLDQFDNGAGGGGGATGGAQILGGMVVR